jgi:predicted amidohydrolase
LVRARALDSTSFIAAAGMAYPGDELAAKNLPTGSGGSLVASPLGEVVAAAAGSEPQLLVADIDLAEAVAARDTIAVLRNRAEFTQSGKAESRG